jgi:hypothetical protein
VFDAVYKSNKWNLEAALDDLVSESDDGDDEAVTIPVTTPE